MIEIESKDLKTFKLVWYHNVIQVSDFILACKRLKMKIRFSSSIVWGALLKISPLGARILVSLQHIHVLIQSMMILHNPLEKNVDIITESFRFLLSKVSYGKRKITGQFRNYISRSVLGMDLYTFKNMLAPLLFSQMRSRSKEFLFY